MTISVVSRTTKYGMTGTSGGVNVGCVSVGCVISSSANKTFTRCVVTTLVQYVVKGCFRSFFVSELIFRSRHTVDDIAYVCEIRPTPIVGLG